MLCLEILCDFVVDWLSPQNPWPGPSTRLPPFCGWNSVLFNSPTLKLSPCLVYLYQSQEQEQEPRLFGGPFGSQCKRESLNQHRSSRCVGSHWWRGWYYVWLSLGLGTSRIRILPLQLYTLIQCEMNEPLASCFSDLAPQNWVHGRNLPCSRILRPRSGWQPFHGLT